METFPGEKRAFKTPDSPGGATKSFEDKYGRNARVYGGGYAGRAEKEEGIMDLTHDNDGQEIRGIENVQIDTAAVNPPYRQMRTEHEIMHSVPDEDWGLGENRKVVDDLESAMQAQAGEVMEEAAIAEEAVPEEQVVDVPSFDPDFAREATPQDSILKISKEVSGADEDRMDVAEKVKPTPEEELQVDKVLSIFKASDEAIKAAANETYAPIEPEVQSQPEAKVEEPINTFDSPKSESDSERLPFTAEVDTGALELEPITISAEGFTDLADALHYKHMAVKQEKLTGMTGIESMPYEKAYDRVYQAVRNIQQMFVNGSWTSGDMQKAVINLNKEMHDYGGMILELDERNAEQEHHVEAEAEDLIENQDLPEEEFVANEETDGETAEEVKEEFATEAEKADLLRQIDEFDAIMEASRERFFKTPNYDPSMFQESKRAFLRANARNLKDNFGLNNENEALTKESADELSEKLEEYKEQLQEIESLEEKPEATNLKVESKSVEVMSAEEISNAKEMLAAMEEQLQASGAAVDVMKKDTENRKSFTSVVASAKEKLEKLSSGDSDITAEQVTGDIERAEELRDAILGFEKGSETEAKPESFAERMRTELQELEQDLEDSKKLVVTDNSLDLGNYALWDRNRFKTIAAEFKNLLDSNPELDQQQQTRAEALLEQLVERRDEVLKKEQGDWVAEVKENWKKNEVKENTDDVTVFKPEPIEESVTDTSQEKSEIPPIDAADAPAPIPKTPEVSIEQNKQKMLDMLPEMDNEMEETVTVFTDKLDNLREGIKEFEDPRDRVEYNDRLNKVERQFGAKLEEIYAMLSTAPKTGRDPENFKQGFEQKFDELNHHLSELYALDEEVFESEEALAEIDERTAAPAAENNIKANIPLAGLDSIKKQTPQDVLRTAFNSLNRGSNDPVWKGGLISRGAKDMDLDYFRNHHRPDNPVMIMVSNLEKEAKDFGKQIDTEGMLVGNYVEKLAEAVVKARRAKAS